MCLFVVAILLGLNCALASKTHRKSFFEKLECCGGKKNEQNLKQDPIEPKCDEVRVIDTGKKEIKEKVVFYKNKCNISLTSALNDAAERKIQKNLTPSFARIKSKQQANKNLKNLDDSFKKTYNPKELYNNNLKIATKKKKDEIASFLFIAEEKSDDEGPWLLDTDVTTSSRRIPNNFMNDFFNVEENLEGQWDADQFDVPKNIDKFEFPRSETSQERLMGIYKERLLEVRTASSASDESVGEDEIYQEHKSKGRNEIKIELFNNPKKECYLKVKKILYFVETFLPVSRPTEMFSDSNDLLTFKANIKNQLKEYESVENTETESV